MKISLLTSAMGLAIMAAGSASKARAEIYPGMILTKEAPDAVQKTMESITNELTSTQDLLTKVTKQVEDKYTELTTRFDGEKANNEEVKKAAEEATRNYAELVKNMQSLTATVDVLKKELDAPQFRSDKELADHDRKNAIELQRRAFLFKGGNEFDFRADLDNLVDIEAYRSAARKLAANVGIETKHKVVHSMLTEPERKAMEAASLDSAFFSPELLGIEIDCTVECAELVDLYDTVTVSRSTFMYPRVKDWGAIGQYDCDAKCDAEFGPAGNIVMENGRTYDFRGVFCFNRKTLAESNYDLLNFMFRSAARSYRINRNRALMVGDGVNEPLGWMAQDCFPKRSAPQPTETNANSLTHQAWRTFLASVPTRYGAVVPVMHQNVFAHLAMQLDNSGRFIFGDGLMSYTPNDVRENIRISDCLPDPTEDLTLTTFAPGEFIAAAANWDSAYASVNKRPMWMEQFEGGSTAWCVKYVFGAEDGGFTKCCDAARILVAG